MPFYTLCCLLRKTRIFHKKQTKNKTLQAQMIHCACKVFNILLLHHFRNFYMLSVKI